MEPAQTPQGCSNNTTDVDTSFEPPDVEDTSSSSKQRYACHYVKNYGRRCAIGKSCPVDGFPSLHRLKEHIDRKHSSTNSCPRCHKEFKNAAEVDAHLQESVACERTAGPSTNRFRCTRAQLQEVKRKRQRGITEEQEWIRIYKVLFGEEIVIPSPYVPTDTHSESSNTAEFELNLRTELKKGLMAAFPDEIKSGEDGAGIKKWLEKVVKDDVIQGAMDRARNMSKRRRTIPTDLSSDAQNIQAAVIPPQRSQSQAWLSQGNGSVQNNSFNPGTSSMGSFEQCRIPQRAQLTPRHVLEAAVQRVEQRVDPATSGSGLYDYVTPSDLDTMLSSQRTEQVDEDWLKISSEPPELNSTSREPADPGGFENHLFQWSDECINQDPLYSFSNVMDTSTSKRRASRSPEREEVFEDEGEREPLPKTGSHSRAVMN